MGHLVEEIWRFKEFGFWAVVTALLIVGLKKASTHIENRALLVAIFVVGIGCFTLISIVVVNNRNKSDKEKELAKKDKLVKKYTDDTEARKDSVATAPVNTTNKDIPDTTRLTCKFMEGLWKVVSTDKDTVINTTVKFECAGQFKTLIKSDNSMFNLHQVSEYSPYNFESNGYYNESHLKLERAGDQMKGVLTTKYEASFPKQGIETKVYQLTFTLLHR